MATLEIARNSWWKTASRDEQEEYLRLHPRSKLKITKRRKKSKPSADDQPPKDAAPTAEKPAEDEAPPAGEQQSDADKVSPLATPAEEPKLDDIPVDGADKDPPASTAEQDEEIKAVLPDQGAVVELSPAEQEQTEDTLHEVGDKLDPDTALDDLDDDDRSELEDDFEEAADEEDPGERTKRYLKATAKLGLKLGLITASVLMVGAVSPHVLFLPSVFTSILQNSDKVTNGTSGFLGSAVDVLHKGLKKAGVGKHARYATKAKKARKN